MRCGRFVTERRDDQRHVEVRSLAAVAVSHRPNEIGGAFRLRGDRRCQSTEQCRFDRLARLSDRSETGDRLALTGDIDRPAVLDTIDQFAKMCLGLCQTDLVHLVSPDQFDGYTEYYDLCPKGCQKHDLTRLG